MLIVHIGFEQSGASIPTAYQSSKLDRAIDLADWIASEFPDVIMVTVRHHRRTDEVQYQVRGKL